ncbi:MAG: Ig-like domain-containing protein [Paludibacteraceae bacterium]|nr:Ig-like domain-containing protein [Paludibacteraceae bacterium]
MKIHFLVAVLILAEALQAASYKKVNSVEGLNAKDTVVLVNEDALKANGAKDKYLATVAIDLYGDTAVTADATELVLDGAADAWTLTTVGGSYVGHKASTLDMSNTATTYKISFADGNVIIQSKTYCTKSGKEGYPKICYNTSAPRFAFYTSSTMAAVQLYKKLPEGQGANVRVSDVQLDADTLYLRAGEQDELTATVLPADAKNKTVEWGSMNEDIATVADGEVSAVAQGETKIWVRTVDGNFTDTCFVKVYASLDQPDVTWNRLQSPDSLKEGTRVFFASVRADEDYIMGIYDYDVSKSNIRGAAAEFDENRHQVTASESYAYTVHIDNGKYVFTDLDGSYLCDYSLKNLSAQDNLDNKARWTGEMTEDFAFKFTNMYNTGYTMYNNHNSDMFCCYNAYDQSNMAYIAIYSDNAPEWVEPVLVPELHILVGKDTIRDTLDFGEVVYDDSWGTETNPYEEAKTLTFVTKDLSDNIYLTLAKGLDFTLYTEEIRPTGGTASVQFSTDTKGSYSDTLYIVCDTIARKIVLKAKAVTVEEVKPSVTFSTRQIYLNPNYQNGNSDAASFTFTTRNMVKNLYIKWENTTGNSVPSRQGETTEILAGDMDVYYGSSTNMGAIDYTDTEVILYSYAYTEGTYTSSLLFYTPDGNDKSKNAFEERVNITIEVTQDPVTTDLENRFVNSSIPQCSKLIRNNRLIIYRFGKKYMVNGQIVRE